MAWGHLMDEFVQGFGEHDFEIRRRPPRPALFVCVACQKPVEDPTIARWFTMRDRDESPPICRMCVRHWTTGNTSRHAIGRITKAEHNTLHRASAMINRLNWEIYNGPNGTETWRWQRAATAAKRRPNGKRTAGKRSGWPGQ